MTNMLARSCVVLILGSGIAGAQPVVEWAAPVSGIWNNALNWNPSMVPGLADTNVHIRFDVAGTYTATLASNTLFPGAELLTISNPVATLQIENAGLPGDFPVVFASYGTVTNDGMIRVGGAGGSGPAAFYSVHEIVGTGSLVLDNSFGQASIGLELDEGSLSQGVDHSIRGSGQFIDTDVTSFGTIRSDVAGGALMFDSSELTNHGLITAQNGGMLEFSGTRMLNAAGGSVVVETGSTMALYDAAWYNELGSTLHADGGTVLVPSGEEEYIAGLGTIRTTNGGLFHIEEGSTLHVITDAADDGPTFDAQMLVSGGADLIMGMNVLIDPSMRNTGRITLNPGASVEAAELVTRGSATIDGDGEIKLEQQTAGAVVRSEPGSVLLHKSGHTIRGHGQIQGDFNNEGFIVADDLAGSLVVAAGDDPLNSNSGTIKATGGAVLEIINTRITGPGLVVAEVGSTVELQDGRLIGGNLLADGGVVTVADGEFGCVEEGTVVATNGGVVHVPDGATFVLSGGTFEGPMNVDGGGYLLLAEYTSPGQVNNGTITMNSDNSTMRVDLELDGNGIAGSGRIVMNSPSFITAFGVSDSYHGPDHTIEGSGFIDVNFVNNGLILANRAGEELEFSTGNIANNGVLAASSGGVLVLDTGEIDQSGGGEIVADNGEVVLQGVSVYLGEMNGIGSGRFVQPSGAFFLVYGPSMDADVDIESGATMESYSLGFTNNGTIRVNSDQLSGTARMRVNESSAIAGSGEIVLNGFAGSDAQIVVAAGQTCTFGTMQTIAGSGVLDGDFVLQGFTAPGQSIGELSHIGGGVIFDESHILRCEIGEFESDKFISDGTLELAGRLVIEWAPAQSLQAGQSFVIIDASTLSGSFEEVEIIQPGTGYRFQLEITQTQYIVNIVCLPDISADGDLDFFDVSAFLSAFGQQDPIADFTGDGNFDFFDVSAFLQAFSVGCP